MSSFDGIPCVCDDNADSWRHLPCGCCDPDCHCHHPYAPDESSLEAVAVALVAALRHARLTVVMVHLTDRYGAGPLATARLEIVDAALARAAALGITPPPQGETT